MKSHIRLSMYVRYVMWPVILLLSGISTSGQTVARRSPLVSDSRLSFTRKIQDQVSTERHAMRLLHRRAIQTELPLLETEWKNRWPDLLPSTLKQAHAAIEELAFLVALETVNNDPRRPRVVQISMPPHSWLGTNVPGGRWGIDNPDTQYFLVPVEADSSYRITGQRHASGPIDSNFSYSNLDNWDSFGNIGHNQLQIAADGSYAITLDNTPPNGRPNHIRLSKSGDTLLIRNTLADWSKEDIDTLEVKRISGPPPAPVPTDDALARTVRTRLHLVLQRVIENLQVPVFKLPENVLLRPGRPGDKAGFLVTQRNTIGHFRLGADEAMVVTINPGGAAYSTLPVTNVWGVTPRYWLHQSSLNSRQAIANSDGTITIVVSAWDPGIANWVDTDGLQEGFIMLRWQGLTNEASRKGDVDFHSTLVKRTDLGQALPNQTVKFGAAERAAQLKERRKGFERRFANR